MTDETIVAVYDTAAHAEAAVAGLKSAGVPENAISMHAGTSQMAGTTATTNAAAREPGFWSSIFGGQPDHDTAVYHRNMAGGSMVVSVRAPETHITQVTEILESHHPIDLTSVQPISACLRPRRPHASRLPARRPRPRPAQNSRPTKTPSSSLRKALRSASGW